VVLFACSCADRWCRAGPAGGLLRVDAHALRARHGAGPPCRQHAPPTRPHACAVRARLRAIPLPPARRPSPRALRIRVFSNESFHPSLFIRVLSSESSGLIQGGPLPTSPQTHESVPVSRHPFRATRSVPPVPCHPFRATRSVPPVPCHPFRVTLSVPFAPLSLCVATRTSSRRLG
jgi:hypothetical protein